jgi:hypothetical protein
VSLIDKGKLIQLTDEDHYGKREFTLPKPALLFMGPRKKRDRMDYLVSEWTPHDLAYELRDRCREKFAGKPKEHVEVGKATKMFAGWLREGATPNMCEWAIAVTLADRTLQGEPRLAITYAMQANRIGVSERVSYLARFGFSPDAKVHNALVEWARLGTEGQLDQRMTMLDIPTRLRE